MGPGPGVPKNPATFRICATAAIEVPTTETIQIGQEVAFRSDAFNGTRPRKGATTRKTAIPANKPLEQVQTDTPDAPRCCTSGGSIEPNAAPIEKLRRFRFRKCVSAVTVPLRARIAMAIPEKPAIATANSVSVVKDSKINSVVSSRGHHTTRRT